MDATNTASLALHGRTLGLSSANLGYIRPLFRLCSTMARTWKKLHRTAKNARKIVAKAIRNTQVPAYCPVELGVQADE